MSSTTDSDKDAHALSMWEQKTQANQRNSPLLRLPAELRNRIYEYAFCSTVVGLHTFAPRRTDCDYLEAAALLSACRHIRHEASSTSYNHYIFQVTPPVFNKFKDSTIAPDLMPWKAIQNIEMLGEDVNWWHFMVQRTALKDYTDALPALRRVQVLNDYRQIIHIDDDIVVNILRTAFGKQGLEVSVLSK